MFFKPDLILLHAPSVYDFRKKPNLFGPISDVVPSTPIFEMYPIGFSSIAEYLEKNNVGVRIINLAYRMLNDAKFDVEKLIAKLKPKAFGIDLHWLVHAQGSIEVAKICKKIHPEIPVIFGGLSATYYHEELIKNPEINFVFRGDSTEIPLLDLMNKIKSGDKNYQSIANLTWKNEQNQIQQNKHSYVPANVNSLSNNYKNLFKIALKYGDIKSMTAIHDWWKYPIIAIMSCRGCTQNCAICGGSHQALKFYANRSKPSYRSAELIVDDIKQLQKYTTGPIFIIGDLNQPGKEYADILLNGLKKLQLKNQMVIEFFNPANEVFFQKVAAAFPNFNFEISPESHDENIRKINGKYYSNFDMEQNIQWALDNGCQKFDIFFMIGISGQTTDSVLETIDYCEYLLDKFDKRVVPFIAPLAPFLDPGSIAYENPEKYGYEILYHSFEEHRKALLNPSWKYFLNYQTIWMNRDQIVDVTYQAGKKLNTLKLKYGLIDKEIYNKVESKINLAQRLVKEIDDIYLIQNEAKRVEKIQELNLNIHKDSMDTICEENEIKWPIFKSGFKFLSIAKAVLFE